MNFLRVAVVATALMCPLFSNVTPLQPPARTDALGRVVRDADSYRITYATNAAGFASLASAATQNPGGGRLEWLTLLTLLTALGYVSRARHRVGRESGRVLLPSV